MQDPKNITSTVKHIMMQIYGDTLEENLIPSGQETGDMRKHVEKTDIVSKYYKLNIQLKTSTDSH